MSTDEFLGELSAPDPDHAGLPHEIEDQLKDTYYPKVVILDEKDEEKLQDMVYEDPIEQKGMELADGIVKETEEFGRRRRPRPTLPRRLPS